MVIVIGAGPIGLAVAVELTKRDIPVKIVEKGALVNSIFNYPKGMTFFSTSDRLEIGEVPFISHGSKPTRREALEYYRRVAEHYNLEIALYEEVLNVEGNKGNFILQTDKNKYEATEIVVATGFYDKPQVMDIPGEELQKVKHYYDEAHAYTWQDIVIIGGGNSAVDAALETYRSNANVTLVVKYPTIKESVKYWVKPDIENRIKNDEIQAFFNSVVKEITPDSVVINTPEGNVTVSNDFVLAMTGYTPNFDLMRTFGIALTEDKKKMPVFDENTLQTNRNSIYVAGVVCGGMDTSTLFIENTRIHAKHIAEHIAEER